MTARAAKATTKKRVRAPRAAAAPKPEQDIDTVLLSGGAPHSPLMAGALYAIWSRGKTFRIFYTSGAGALMVLLNVAPKGTDPGLALQNWPRAGVADEIYRFFPINYKLFRKPGPFAPLFEKLAERFKLATPATPETPTPPNAVLDAWKKLAGGWVEGILQQPQYRRLYNDWVDLVFTLLTPSTLTPSSQGMAAPIPFLEELVDFDKLKAFPGELYVNAFNMTDGKMEMFDKTQIDGRHIRAAFSFPFIYPPANIDGKYYSEGADRDPINFDGLIAVDQRHDIRTVVLIDIMGSLQQALVRPPTNLWDAYVISIMTPIVALAQKNVEHFEKHQSIDPKTGERFFDLVKIQFDIPSFALPYVMDWSHSNMRALWRVGYEAGVKFCEQYGDRLPDNPDGPKTPPPLYI